MKTLYTATVFLGLMTLLTGILYPAAMTGIAAAVFTGRARGGIVYREGKPVGSRLLAQKFSAEQYFWPRPSAVDYATLPSGAGNQGLTNAALKKDYKERLRYWKNVIIRSDGDWGTDTAVPADLLFASGSGLDPHISPAAARLQIDRVAAARHFSPGQKQSLRELVEKNVERPILGFIGEPRVNVLLLNLALDDMR